jgi:signal transduction histidine kinase
MTLDEGLDEYGLNKKRTVLLLRSVVTVALSYLVLFTEAGTATYSVTYILALIVSNIALTLIPAERYSQKHFSKMLFLFDTAAVLIGLYFTVGFSQDFLIVYFFTMLLTAVVDTLAQIAIGAIAISILYGTWLWMTAGKTLGSAEWLRLPFFFIVAIFYAYMTEEVKRERARRFQAERESEHLRFLLLLGDAFTRHGATADWAERVKSVIETAFPRLTCQVASTPPAAAGQHAVWVPFVTHSRVFGGLLVETKDGVALRPDEEQFCGVAAFVAANGLYTTEQARAVGDSVRLKEEFLANLSHEFRTPLHGLLGYLDLLEDTVVPDAEGTVRDCLNRVRINASRLQNLLEEMLWFAELRAGHRPKVVERVDLRDVFAQFDTVVSQELVGRPIRFESQIDSDVPPLQTDGRKLRQIISGLLSNAVKFTEKGVIRLRARGVHERQIEITVEDSGIGIDPGHFNLIFEEFRQIDGSLTRRADGLGLGLALAHELTLLLGGHISVESDAHGSTFRVRLPVADGPAADRAPAFTPVLRLADSFAN